jgi:hypothetical protein
MAVPITEIRESDNKGRITLPKGFANSTLLVEVVSDKELVIRKAKVVPLGPDEDLPPLTTLKPLSDRDRDAFLAALDNPPPPNEALKRLMSGTKPQK